MGELELLMNVRPLSVNSLALCQTKIAQHRRKDLQAPLCLAAVSHFTEGLKLFSLKCLAYNVSLKRGKKKKIWCFL